MRSRYKRLYLVLLLIGYFAIAYTAMHYLDITCVFLKIFGIPCPGCGMTRAFLSLLELDFYSAAKYIFLSIITLGIYGLVVMSSVSNDINIAASRYDGKKTMHYCLLAFLIGPITLGIAYIVWFHKISNRIGNELKRRNIAYSFSCADYWLWNVLGSFIIVGPFIYYHKLFKATNLMCADYNVKG